MITTAFVRKFQGLVKSVAHDHEKDPQKFEDLVQDIWLHVCRKADMLPEDEKAHSTWLQVLAERVCMDHIRATKKDVELVLDSTLTPPTEDSEAAPEGSWIEQAVPSGDTAEDAQLLQELMLRAATLSEQETAIFNLVYWHGNSYEAVGKKFGIDVRTVGAVVTRIRDKLETKELYHSAYTYHAPGAVWGDWAWKPQGEGNLRMENNKDVKQNSSGKASSGQRQAVQRSKDRRADYAVLFSTRRE